MLLFGSIIGQAVSVLLLIRLTPQRPESPKTISTSSVLTCFARSHHIYVFDHLPSAPFLIRRSDLFVGFLLVIIPIDTVKMKTAVLASLIATAAAFAPAKQATTSTSLKAFEDELGAQPPLDFSDPLGLVADGEEEKFERLRYFEIKHSHISMLAVVGYLVAEAGIRLPEIIDYSGLAFSDVPNGFAALNTISGAGIAQNVVFIGFSELAVMKDIVGEELVVDFRNDAIDFG
jgi:hypothetical protein